MEEIIRYIMETPGNTNPNILREMLSDIGGNNNGSSDDIIEIIPAHDTGSEIVLEKTWAEINSMIENHKIPICFFTNSDNNINTYE